MTHALQQVSPLFDHLVGEGEQRGRNGEVERFRCPHIQHELELHWLLDRKIGDLGALQDLVHMARRAPIEFLKARLMESPKLA